MNKPTEIRKVCQKVGREIKMVTVVAYVEPSDWRLDVTAWPKDQQSYSVRDWALVMGSVSQSRFW